MKRRYFVKATTAAVALPAFLNGMPVTAFSKSKLFDSVSEESDRVLVLVQLNGGNDGLNTLFPLDQYDKLANLRSNLILPESSILKLNDLTGFHSSMSAMKDMNDDGLLTVVQNVGYPDQNRSHFRSTDIWTSASNADEILTSGWLGRYFGSKYPNYPTGYPNTENPDPFAITLGALVSETCQGVGANFSTALLDPSTLSQLNEGQAGVEDPSTCYGMEVAFLRNALTQTNAYAAAMTTANDAGANVATYPANNKLADQLKVAAKLISGGLKTKVYITSLGGFDTHADQVNANNTATGVHADLLQQVSDAVAAFQADLLAQGLEKRVIGMTFSEFGRQIKSNDSGGTDHGNAAPLFLFGSCVNPGIIGNNADIPDTPDPQAGVAMEVDFRSIYGTLLNDWFEMPEADVSQILFDGWQHLPLLQICNATSTFDPKVDVLAANLFPNPCTTTAHLVFNTEDENVRVSLFNSIGHEIRLLSDQRFTKGEHKISFRVDDLPAANYYIRINSKRASTTKSLVKM